MAKARMVEWYNPMQLLRTAKKTVFSTIIGENADPRLVNAPSSYGKFFDYSVLLKRTTVGEFEETTDLRNEIWIDYVADVGDGWNPTYAVAYSLAQRSLRVDGETLPRGEVLIFGGDQVYPTATAEEYESRLTNPYRTAFATVGNSAAEYDPNTDLKVEPHVFALPGNHDWYDSLVSFHKIFCTHLFNCRRFANAWVTRQKRSYFALKLPGKWWLIGADLQLSHNLDVRQLQYFESVAAKFEAGDRIILCVPEPFWVKALKYRNMTDFFQKKEETLERLERTLTSTKVHPDDPPKIRLYLAGDLHHYRRFESQDGERTQKITAGGGGAFLHPTHDFDFDPAIAGNEKSDHDFTLEKQYPDAATSRGLDWFNLFGFGWRNKTFGIFTAIVYPILALLIHGDARGAFDWTTLFRATIDRLVEEPLSLLLVLLLIGGLIFFTDSNSRFQKWIGGFLHALAHMTAAFILGWLAFFLAVKLMGTTAGGYEAYRAAHATRANLCWFTSVVGVGAVGGYFIGSLLMGIYLFVSLHIFGRHDNEAFSALKIQDFKNFLRLHIDREGGLTIYPFKIERVPRKWIDDGEKCRPATPFEPELIESPIRIN